MINVTVENIYYKTRLFSEANRIRQMDSRTGPVKWNVLA
jgi:hypothetical protein